jgi:hypothetical protein
MQRKTEKATIPIFWRVGTLKQTNPISRDEVQGGVHRMGDTAVLLSDNIPKKMQEGPFRESRGINKHTICCETLDVLVLKQVLGFSSEEGSMRACKEAIIDLIKPTISVQYCPQQHCCHLAVKDHPYLSTYP